MINPQRKLNSSMPSLKVGTLPAAPPRPVHTDHSDQVGRDGRVQKRTVDAPPVPGMKSQSRPDGLHPWLHSQPAPLQDEPNLPLKSHEKTIPFHDGMTDQQIVKVANNPTSSQILHDAANLGRPRKA